LSRHADQRHYSACSISARRWRCPFGDAPPARSGAAAALPGLPGPGRRPRPVSGMVVQTVLHHATLLRAARHAVRLRPRPGILSMEAIAALAAAIGAAFQSIGHLGGNGFAANRRARRRRRAQADQANGAAGWAVANRAHRQCRERLPRTRRRQSPVTGRRLVLIDNVLTSGATVDGAPGPCCAPGPAMAMCWYLPGLPSRHERPYKTLLKIATDHG